MRIESVTIQNFRGIRFMQLDFNGLVNVIIGNNGVGKSSILNAVEILYSWLAARIKSDDGSGRSISQKDITNGEPFCQLSMTASHEGKTATWTLSKRRSGFRGVLKEKSNFAELRQFVADYNAKSVESDFSNWPMLMSYGVNRSVVKMQLSAEKNNIPDVAAMYDTSNFGKGINWHEMFNWYVSKEYEENSLRVHLSKEYRDVQLESIRNCIERLLPEFSNLHVAAKPIRLVVDKNGQEFDFSQLSDGEKCYIALMMDITRHITMMGGDPQKVEQVFLIDEVDLHLHPQWQMNVVGSLKRLFPKSQFILTSHSSLILSDLNPEDGDTLVVLDKGAKKDVSTMPYGDTSNYILQRYFGLSEIRNAEVQEKIDAAADELAKDKPDLGKVKEQLEWLEKRGVRYDEAYKLNLDLKRKEKYAQGE